MLFVLLCAFIAIRHRHFFDGEMTETSIGWELTNGPTDRTELGPKSVLEQVFYPQKDVLNLIYVAVNGHGETGKMVVTVRDEAGAEVARREIACSEMVRGGGTRHLVQSEGDSAGEVFVHRDV